MVDASRIYVGLDLGTTKICTVIAEVAPDGEWRIIGVGTAPSDGLRRGVVVDVGKTVQSISRAVQEAQTTAGVEVTAVYTGIAGEHIGCLDSCGVVAVDGPASDSLILLKPLAPEAGGGAHHGGTQFMDADCAGYRTLETWIEGGR